jgi:hypothetical protein
MTRMELFRNRGLKITESSLRFAIGQTQEHNILSENGHEWFEDKKKKTRSCKRCFRVETNPDNWTQVPNPVFTLEDIEAFIEVNGRM